MFTFISLPNNFTNDIASTSTDMLGSFSPYIILIIGVLLAGLIIQMIIGAVKHH